MREMSVSFFSRIRYGMAIAGFISFLVFCQLCVFYFTYPEWLLGEPYSYFLSGSDTVYDLFALSFLSLVLLFALCLLFVLFFGVLFSYIYHPIHKLLKKTKATTWISVYIMAVVYAVVPVTLLSYAAPLSVSAVGAGTMMLFAVMMGFSNKINQSKRFSFLFFLVCMMPIAIVGFYFLNEFGF